MYSEYLTVTDGYIKMTNPSIFDLINQFIKCKY